MMMLPIPSPHLILSFSRLLMVLLEPLTQPELLKPLEWLKLLKLAEVVALPLPVVWYGMLLSVSMCTLWWYSIAPEPF